MDEEEKYDVRIPRGYIFNQDKTLITLPTVTIGCIDYFRLSSAAINARTFGVACINWKSVSYHFLLYNGNMPDDIYEYCWCECCAAMTKYILKTTKWYRMTIEKHINVICKDHQRIYREVDPTYKALREEIKTKLTSKYECN